jgi:hypothetical protein
MLDGAMDFAGETPGLTASSADTSAISMLSELKSAAPIVDVDASSELGSRDSDNSRGRFSMRLVGESIFVDRRLLVVAEERVLILREEGVLIVPFDLTGVLGPGLFCGAVRVILGSNILDEVEMVD